VRYIAESLPFAFLFVLFRFRLVEMSSRCADILFVLVGWRSLTLGSTPPSPCPPGRRCPSQTDGFSEMMVLTNRLSLRRVRRQRPVLVGIFFPSPFFPPIVFWRDPSTRNCQVSLLPFFTLSPCSSPLDPPGSAARFSFLPAFLPLSNFSFCTGRTRAKVARKFSQSSYLIIYPRCCFATPVSAG